ncbi:MAG: Pr6Pr family membrane protein [Clostridiales bacterium]|nr:Pr6Pr family membrane protein [Clostridiales bacterium]
MAKKITSLILKTIVILSATVGVVLQVVEASAAILYFTIQSNIWICTICIAGLVLILINKPMRGWMYSLKLVFTVSITLTGVVYCSMLAPFLGDQAYSLSNTLLHVIVPIASVADFLVYDSVQYRKWECVTATIPPFYYLGFAGVGYALNWQFLDGHNYPYFFLDWGSPAGAFGFASESPYMGVFYYVLILLAFVIGVGALYIFLAKLLYRKQAQKHIQNSNN